MNYSSRSQSVVRGALVVRHCPRSGPRRPQVNYCDISNMQLRTKKKQGEFLFIGQVVLGLKRFEKH